MSTRCVLRAAVAALVASSLALAAPAAAQDAPAVRVLLSPERIEVGGSSEVAVIVENAPPLRGFEIVLAYDPEALAVTGAVPGDLLSASGSTIGHQAGRPGELRLFATIATDDAALRPQGSGALARVTLGALADAGTWDLALDNVELLTAVDGDGLGAADVAVSTGAVVEIVVPPTDEERAVLVEAAEAFAAEAIAAPGPGASLVRALDGLRNRLSDEASAVGPLLAWLGLLAAGALIALVGWWLGRDAVETGQLSR